MDLYAEHILDHYRAPRHQGSLDQPSVSHTERNLSCGDALTVMLRLDEDRITEIAWSGTGCAISQAAMSMISETLQGKTIKEMDALSPKEVLALLGVPIGARRLKCALLSLHTLKNALHALRGDTKQTWAETVEMT